MRETLKLLLAGSILLTTPLAGAPAASREEVPDPGTTRLATPRVEIEMDLASGRPMVGLTVDGKGPYRFIVDTGASLSVLDDGIATTLGLEEVGRQVLRSPGSTAEIQGRRVRAGRLEAGGLSIDGPILATMDLAKFSGGTLDGVLGRPHFSGLLWTLDYPASRLVLERGELEAGSPGTLRIDQSQGSVRFPIDVAGVSVPMVLDTGSPGGFTLPRRLEARLPFRSDPVPGPTIRLVGGVHPTWRAALDGTIVLGDLRYESPEVVLTSQAEDFGNIGFSVLRELRVTLDQAAGVVRFERQTAPALESPTVIRRGPAVAGGASGPPRLGIAFAMTPAGFVMDQGGLVVERVDSGGAADQAGLRTGDLIVGIGGRKVAGLDSVAEIGALLRAPRPLELEILRESRRMTVVVR